MKSRAGVKKLPSYVLSGAKPISRPYSNRFRMKRGPDYVNEYLGVRRVNETCLEVFPGARTIKSVFSSAVGVLFLFGVAFGAIILIALPGPYSIDIWFALIFTPFLTTGIGGLIYIMARGSPGSPVRISRKTGKIYYVIPDEFRLVTLDWQEMQPMAGRLSVSGGVFLNPLFLVGIDWTQSPPREAAISCGNEGLRDNGESACELFSYIHHFMSYGPQGLPMPGPPAPKMSRKDTFLYGYREWAKKYREDLSTPKGKRWAVLWAPAKVLWLITMVFPDSIGAYLDYTVPDVRFPKSIDLLCGFDPDSDDAY